MAYSLLIFTP